MKFARLCLLLPLCFGILGMAKKNTVAVRFHLEANPRDGEPFSIPAKFHHPDRDGFVEKIPAISERDIAAIFPVSATDGTFGCVFKLDSHGSIGLKTLSSDRRGSVMVGLVSTRVGTRQIAEILVDKPINDGVIYVPKGFSTAEMTELQKQFPIIGQSVKRK